jgi:DNA-binding MarR family transcriptional regulator/GNAT superfamily N-acetyltransferase
VSKDLLTQSEKVPASWPVPDEQVTAVREFNRRYTAVVGLLREGLLDTPYSLTEARVIFELAREGGAHASDLRHRLGLDAGYLSRILARFESDGIVARTRSPRDARRQVVALTGHGKDVFARLDALSAEQVRGMLGRLPPGRRRDLTAAMATIGEIVSPAPERRPAAFVLRPPAPGDLGWVVQRNGALYAAEYGWDDSYEALVARIVADYAQRAQQPGPGPRREAGWIAEAGGEPVGCVFCMRKSGGTAQLRLLLVEPEMRGMGIGERLVAECVSFARRAGYAEIVLWTNDVLHAARRIYQRVGFELAGSAPHHSFGHDLVGEDWRLALAAGT